MRTIFIIILSLAFWCCIGQRFLKYVPLEIELFKIQNKQYKEGYKCEEFSKELVEQLRNRGIQAEVVYGESESTAYMEGVIHAWVGVWIEPQTGEFTENYIVK